MSFKKPSVKKTNTTLNSLRIYLRSVKKWGKSTLFRDMILEEYGDPEKGLLVGIGNEMGYGLLDELNTAHVDNWKDLEELKKYLIEGKINKEHEIEIVAFDVIDELIPIAEKEICRRYEVKSRKPCDSINKAEGGYGKGQDACVELMKSYFSDLYKAGFGIMAIAHVKQKNIIEKGMEETEGYQMLTSNLSNKYEAVFGDIFDCVLTGVIDKDISNGRIQSSSRKLYFRGTCEIDAGCRFKEGTVPEYMDFEGEDKTREFIDILKEGMRKSKKKTMTREKFDEEAKKDKIKEDEKAKEFIQDKVEEDSKVNKAELLDEIKALATTTEARKKLTEYMKASNVSKVGDFNVEQLKEIREALAR